MALTVPQIDDRSYDQILAEALARIPVHNPEWTNFNDSDPGVTLVQLFAFMTDNLLYRSNLIPERNRRKFLTLLGVPLQAAASSQGMVAFSNPRGPLQSETLAPGLELLAGQVPFRCLDGLDVLPVEAQVYYKSPMSDEEGAEIKELYQQLYRSFQQQESDKLSFYQTKTLEAPASGATFPVINLSAGNDTVDGSLWIALLARSKNSTVVEQTRQAIANRVLTLGVMPALTDSAHVLRPAGLPSAEGQPNLIFQMPIGETLPEPPQPRMARYKTLDARSSGDLLSEPGVVELPLPGKDALVLWDNLEPLESGAGDFPPSLEDTEIQERVITWIRIRLRNETTNGAGESQGRPSTTGSSSSTAGSSAGQKSDNNNQLSARLSWVGINAARVTQRVHVFGEKLGAGTGEPDQHYILVNTPIVPNSTTVTVNGETWLETDDLMAAGSEVPVRDPRLPPTVPPSSTSNVKVYTLDRESGEVRFGDGMRGARPPAGAIIRANYDYGGGRQGNVGIGAIAKGPSLPAGLKVANPLPTWGGDEAESVSEAERRIPRFLQHRDRLVTKDDFATIVWRTPGVDLGRVEILPLFHPEIQDVLSEGVVTVMVIPRYDVAQPEAPTPDRLFLDTVCNYLDPRRMVTTEVHVRGPVYKSIWLSVGIDVVPGYDLAPVREAVKASLRQHLSPLFGGYDGQGWPLEKAVEALELWAVATRVEGVAKVNGVQLGTESGSATDRIALTGLQLPRLESLSVQSGEAEPLADLRGDEQPPGDGQDPAKVVPVPVVPPECD